MNQLTYKAGIDALRNDTIVLGRVGEHLAQAIVFDCSAFVQLYGMGTAVLYARLPSGEKYPVPVAQEGSTVTWTVRAADLGTAGLGRGELQWIVNGAVAKTHVFRTRIRESLTGTDVEAPPAPYQDWVDSVTQRSETAAGTATAKAAAASASAAAALTSQSAAENSASAASASAGNAATSERNAALSAQSAAASASSASTDRSSAQTAASNAANSAAAAAASQTAAGTSANNAAQSAQTAADSETAAVAAKNRTEEVVRTYEALPVDFKRLYEGLLDGSVPVPMLDSGGEPILDSSGEALLGREALASAGGLDALETYLRQQLTLIASRFSNVLERLDRMQTELDALSD